MARTNLAYIDTAVGAALEKEVQTPTLTTEAAARAAKVREIKLVAGLVVADDSAAAGERIREEARDARRAKIGQFQRDRLEVIEKLAKLGVAPRAVAPLAVWERLCDMHDLYRLSPDTNGRVGVQDGKALLARLEKWSKVLNLTFWLGGGIAAWAIFWMTKNPAADLPAEPWRPYVLGALVLVGVVIWGSETVTSGDGFVALSYRALVGGLLRAYRFMPHRTLLRQYFPKRTSAETRYTAPQVTVILPNPPEEVAARLLKVHMLNLEVAVVPEAIGFLETPAQVYRDDLQASHDAYEERMRARRDLLRDPIITHRHKSAVAIIDQYGDFPMEKKIVDQCVHSEFLI
ncbi:hypothetical protein HYT05_04155 [Candidatus Kaiserbacteria bacterium]|nr:hypothetical protein [Candidatus Kaiserbacteria bacterium]